MTNLSEVFIKLWREFLPDNVVYMDEYRYYRNKNFPNVGFRQFHDYHQHKVWMRKEEVRVQREKKNREIALKYKFKSL